MPVTALETKAVDDLTAEDVHAFIAAAPLETETLEFKREADNWAVRRAVCGLANAYGGTFVVGVAERDGVAAALHLVPECADEAHGISQNLTASISPPLVGLKVKAIPIDGSNGVVVIRTPASPRRPHSVSKTGRNDALHVFVRSGAATRPADIREVQDMTLVAASQANRVLARIAALKAPVIEAREQADPINRPAYQVFLCATPQTPTLISRIGRKHALRCRTVDFETEQGRILWRWFEGDWRPAFQRLHLDADWDDSRSRASIHSDGSCDFHFALKPEPTEARADRDQTLYLGRLLGMYVALVLTCERIRRVVDEPTLPFSVSAYIACDHHRVPLLTGSEHWTAIGAMGRGAFDHDVVDLGDEDDVQRLLNDVVTHFHNFAGREGPEADRVFDLEPVRRHWGLLGG